MKEKQIHTIHIPEDRVLLEALQDYLQRLEELLWRVAAGPRGKPPRDRELARAAARLSGRYNRQDPPTAGAMSASERLAQLLFFTLSDAPKAMLPLAELARAARLPGGDRPMRVLDVGAGCGAQSLGLLGLLGALGHRGSVELAAQDRDRPALDLLRRTLDLASQGDLLPFPVTVRLLPGDLARPRGEPLGEAGYQLVLAGSVLNELPEPAGLPLLRRLLGLLGPRGTLLVVEPALRQSARRLHRLRDQLAREGVEVLAPCTCQRPCPMLDEERDWCHERRPWLPPPRLRRLTRMTGLRRRDLRWSYLTLGRQDPEAAAPPQAGVFRVVSDPLRSKGKLELFLCGAPGRLRACRLGRHRSRKNEPFGHLSRGQVVRILDAEAAGERLLIGEGCAVEVLSARSDTRKS